MTKKIEDQNQILNIKEKRLIKASLKPSFFQILREWKFRAQRIRLIRSQVAGFIELSTSKVCQFCPKTWSLRCEIMENIEDLLKEFVIFDKKQSMVNWDIASWQNFFIKHAKFRTTCFQCTEKILDHHRKISRIKLVPGQKTINVIRKKNRKIGYQTVISLILKQWRCLAQQNLYNINHR